MQLLDVLEAKDESFSKHVMKVWGKYAIYYF